MFLREAKNGRISHIIRELVLGVFRLQKLEYDPDPHYIKILPGWSHVPNTASVDWHVPCSRITLSGIIGGHLWHFAKGQER